MAFTPLNALSAFLAVAPRLSYASAAKDLGISSSALSQSVRQLEERLGVTLLRRTSRSVALTEARGRRGRTFHVRLHGAVTGLQYVLEPHVSQELARGELRVVLEA